jgi:hypothetical protein
MASCYLLPGNSERPGTILHRAVKGTLLEAQYREIVTDVGGWNAYMLVFSIGKKILHQSN